jgi:hypothetical protein
MPWISCYCEYTTKATLSKKGRHPFPYIVRFAEGFLTSSSNTPWKDGKYQADQSASYKKKPKTKTRKTCCNFAHGSYTPRHLPHTDTNPCISIAMVTY